MNVRGTSVAAVDIPEGTALTFITTGDVVALRASVRTLATAWSGTDTSARVEDIENGARIVLTPVAPDQLAVLRDLTHKRAAYMARGLCELP